MTRKCYVYIDGVAIDKEDHDALDKARGRSSATVLPDLPDFVSPIDGKTYSGRAGLRSHNDRHNVVLADDLKGLPPKTTQQEFRATERQVAERRRHLAEIYNHYQGN